MRELNSEEVKSIQLNILSEVADFCDENDIIYFLCGGTLLGAIRHKGFIPWDDDIDIMMPRCDYERLVNIFKSDNLTLYHHNFIQGYNRPFVKISDNKTKATLPGNRTKNNYEIGINLDIFPLDGFPDSANLTNFHIMKIYFCKRILSYGSYKHDKSFIHTLYNYLYKIILFFFSEKDIADTITKMSKKYKFESSRYAGISVWGYGKREVCPKHIFIKQMDMLFEGYTFKGLRDFDTYLSNVYGNYMKLPPPEERKPKLSHSLKYFTKTAEQNQE
jgi:lipopolysaccharide cholinephosphotransferase